MEASKDDVMQLLEPVSVIHPLSQKESLTPPSYSADIAPSRDSDQAPYASHIVFSPAQDYLSDLWI